VPNWGQEPDKTFDVRLTDSSGDHEIYLTRLDFEPALPGRASPESARNSLRARAGERGAPGAAGLVSADLVSAGTADLLDPDPSPGTGVRIGVRVRIRV